MNLKNLFLITEAQRHRGKTTDKVVTATHPAGDGQEIDHPVIDSPSLCLCVSVVRNQE